MFFVKCVLRGFQANENRIKGREMPLVVMVCLHCWTLETDTETDKKWVIYDCVEVFIVHRDRCQRIDSHWVLCSCSRYLSRYRSLAV